MTTIPVHKNPSSDLTIFVDPSWLMTPEKYLISHALESILVEFSPEQTIQREVDKFVSSFSGGIYQLTEYDIQNFITRLKQTTPKQHTTKLVEFVGIYNTIGNRITQNFDELVTCLHRSFEFEPDKFSESYEKVLCTGIEYAVNNIKRGKSIIMITGSPAKNECQRVIELAVKRQVKIHVLFATDIKVNQHDIGFYKHMTDALDSEFHELKRSFITEMQLEQIFRNIITPTALKTWPNNPRKPDNPYFVN